jgi:outer membrane protein TolC
MKHASLRWFLLVLVATSTCLAQQPPLLTLEAAISAAIAGNKQVQISALDVTKASEATAEARTARLPQLHSYILGGVALNPIDFTIPRGTLGVYPGIGALPAQDSTISTPRRLTALVYGSAAQPISQLFFKIRLGIRESQLGEQLARENLRQQRQETAHQVRQAYYELVETQTQIASAEATLQYLTELAALTERNLAEQTVLKSDTLNVKAKLSQQRFQLLTLRDAQDTRKEALNRLLGRDIRTEFSIEPEPLPSAEELDLAVAQKKAIQQRPEIRKANLQTAKAELDVRRERAEYLPNFSLQLSYLSLANVNFLPQNMTSAGFLFEWQPFDWGQKHHRIQALQATVKQATLTTQDAEQQILIDVNAKYRKLLETRALLDTQAAVQDAEREKLRVVMNRYKENAVLLTDVLQQQSSLAQADSQYQQSVAGFWKAKADFERALGEEY